jgi:predicted DNA binding CopG/RHH family protein
MKAPLFVKMENYVEMTNTMAEIRAKIEDAKESLRKLDEVKQREHEEIKKWTFELVNAEKALNRISEQIPKPE